MPSISKNARDYFVKCKHFTQVRIVEHRRPISPDTFDMILGNATDAVLLTSTCSCSLCTKIVPVYANQLSEKTDKPIYFVPFYGTHSYIAPQIAELLNDNVLEGIVMRHVLGEKVRRHQFEKDWVPKLKKAGANANTRITVAFTSGKRKLLSEIRNNNSIYDILCLTRDANVCNMPIEDVREVFYGCLIVDGRMRGWEDARAAVKAGADAIVFRNDLMKGNIENYKGTIEAVKRDWQAQNY